MARFAVCQEVSSHALCLEPMPSYVPTSEADNFHDRLLSIEWSRVIGMVVEFWYSKMHYSNATFTVLCPPRVFQIDSQCTHLDAEYACLGNVIWKTEHYGTSGFTFIWLGIFEQVRVLKVIQEKFARNLREDDRPRVFLKHIIQLFHISKF